MPCLSICSKQHLYDLQLAAPLYNTRDTPLWKMHAAPPKATEKEVVSGLCNDVRRSLGRLRRVIYSSFFTVPLTH